VLISPQGYTGITARTPSAATICYCEDMDTETQEVPADVRLCPSCGAPADEAATRCPLCEAVLDPDVAAPADHTPPSRESQVDYGDLTTTPNGVPETSLTVAASMRSWFMRTMHIGGDDPSPATAAQLARVSVVTAGLGLLLSPTGLGVVFTPVVAGLAIGCATVSFRRLPGWKIHPLALVGFVIGMLILVAWARLLWFSFAFGVTA
jgi:hypothetical protein